MTDAEKPKRTTRRRGRGEHSIYQRSSDGRWVAEVRDGLKPSGKPRIKYLTAKTKTEVQRKLREEVKRLAQGRPDTGATMTVAAYLTRWLEDTVRPRNRRTTYDAYESLCRVQIIPRIGHRKLKDLTPQDIQHMLSDMVTNPPPGARDGTAPASPATAKNARGVLRKALNDAMRTDLLWRNVVTMTDMPAQKTYVPKPLTPDELTRFQAAARGHRLEALFFTLTALGLREGEAFGLRWQDIDLEAGVLRVRYQLQRIGKPKRPQFVEPKTERSRRPIPVPPQIVDVLKAHRDRQTVDRMLAGDRWGKTKVEGDWDGLMFCTSLGTPLDPANVLKEYRTILKAAGIDESTRIHDLRHTCATMLARLGVHSRTAQDILRHAQVTTTLAVYTSTDAENLRDAVGLLGALFAPTVNAGTDGTDPKSGDE